MERKLSFFDWFEKIYCGKWEDYYNFNRLQLSCIEHMYKDYLNA